MGSKRCALVVAVLIGALVPGAAAATPYDDDFTTTYRDASTGTGDASADRASGMISAWAGVGRDPMAADFGDSISTAGVVRSFPAPAPGTYTVTVHVTAPTVGDDAPRATGSSMSAYGARIGARARLTLWMFASFIRCTADGGCQGQFATRHTAVLACTAEYATPCANPGAVALSGTIVVPGNAGTHDRIEVVTGLEARATIDFLSAPARASASVHFADISLVLE